jgi:hypothetical protein
MIQQSLCLYLIPVREGLPTTRPESSIRLECPCFRL